MISEKQQNYKANIFLVEDCITSRTLLIKILEWGGYRVIDFAENGKEAVEKVREISENSEEKIDIILMDYHLPLKDGIDATREILEFAENSKIIFLSANDDIKEKAFATGAIAFLEKPYKINDVIDTITNTLKNSITRQGHINSARLKGEELSVDYIDEILSLYKEFEAEKLKNSISINRKLKNLIRKLLKTIPREEYLRYWFLIQLLFKTDILDEYHNGAKPLELLNELEYGIYSEIIYAEFLTIYA